MKRLPAPIAVDAARRNARPGPVTLSKVKEATPGNI